MPFRPPNFRFWLRRVLAWDGLLPFTNAFVPVVINFALPNNKALFSITAVGLPIVSLCIRAIMGKGQIESNNCGTTVRYVQGFVFILAILLLLFLDAFLIAVAMSPLGLAGLKGGDASMTLGLLAVYVFLMIIAMYPGPNTTREADDDGNMGFERESDLDRRALGG